MVGAAAFAKRLGVAAPLLLLLIGIGYSYIPGVPPIEVDSHVILSVVLPPLLYGAAINVPIVDFRRNFGSISGLSVLLVLVSALVTGFVLFVILEKLDLGAAIALGAVISPTDVVAATAIGRRLGSAAAPALDHRGRGAGQRRDRARAAEVGGRRDRAVHLEQLRSLGPGRRLRVLGRDRAPGRPGDRVRDGVHPSQAERSDPRHRDLVRRAVPRVPPRGGAEGVGCHRRRGGRHLLGALRRRASSARSRASRSGSTGAPSASCSRTASSC